MRSISEYSQAVACWNRLARDMGFPSMEYGTESRDDNPRLGTPPLIISIRVKHCGVPRLSRTEGVGEGAPTDAGGVQGHDELPSRGAIRTDEPDSSFQCIGRGEHCRRLWEGKRSGARSIPANGHGIG